jgi:putative SOS response-associated peptidase YedK
MDSQYKPTYNAQAAQLLPLITNKSSDSLSFYHWGVIPGMARKNTVSPKLLFLEDKELKSKSIHQQSLLNNRCVIPVQGFFWGKPIGKKKSSPAYVFLNNHQPAAVAGIWSQFDDFDGNIHYTFKMLTQRTFAEYTVFGESIPLTLPISQISTWLSPDQSLEDLLSALVLPELSDIGTYSVSPRIFDQGQDDEGLIKATSPTDQHGNYTLFD